MDDFTKEMSNAIEKRNKARENLKSLNFDYRSKEYQSKEDELLREYVTELDRLREKYPEEMRERAKQFERLTEEMIKSASNA